MVLCRTSRPRRHIPRRTCVQQAIPPDTEEIGVFVYRNQRHCRDCGIMCLYMRFTPFMLISLFLLQRKAYFPKNATFLRCFFKNNANPFQNRFETDLHCVS